MRVSDVLALLASGASESEIVEDYPYLTVEDIRASLEYASATHAARCSLDGSNLSSIASSR